MDPRTCKAGEGLGVRRFCEGQVWPHGWLLLQEKTFQGSQAQKGMVAAPVGGCQQYGNAGHGDFFDVRKKECPAFNNSFNKCRMKDHNTHFGGLNQVQVSLLRWMKALDRFCAKVRISIWSPAFSETWRGRLPMFCGSCITYSAVDHAGCWKPSPLMAHRRG